MARHAEMRGLARRLPRWPELLLKAHICGLPRNLLCWLYGSSRGLLSESTESCARFAELGSITSLMRAFGRALVARDRWACGGLAWAESLEDDILQRERHVALRVDEFLSAVSSKADQIDRSAAANPLQSLADHKLVGAEIRGPLCDH